MIQFSYTYIYKYILFFFFYNLCCYRLLQDIEHSSLCSTVGPCWLFNLYIVVCIFQSQTPNLSLPSLCFNGYKFAFYVYESISFFFFFVILVIYYILKTKLYLLRNKMTNYSSMCKKIAVFCVFHFSFQWLEKYKYSFSHVFFHVSKIRGICIHTSLEVLNPSLCCFVG